MRLRPPPRTRSPRLMTSTSARLSVAGAASARYGWSLHVIENANDHPPVEQPEALLRAAQRSAPADDYQRRKL